MMLKVELNKHEITEAIAQWLSSKNIIPEGYSVEDINVIEVLEVRVSNHLSYIPHR